MSVRFTPQTLIKLKSNNMKGWINFHPFLIQRNQARSRFNSGSIILCNKGKIKFSGGVTIKYKLRIYKTEGSNKGRLDHEEFFASFEDAKARYYELFDYNLFSLNPTIWELCDNEWIRILG